MTSSWQVLRLLTLAELKRFMLASANLPGTVLELAPYLIPEQRITLFKFYMQSVIHDGMTDGNELYRLAREFGKDNRLKSYQYACQLIEQGIPTLVSVSAQQYRVWISLRSPIAAKLAQVRDEI